MGLATVYMKEAVVKVLDELPSERVAEVLDFVLFLKQRSQAQRPQYQRPVVRPIPAAHLDALVGLVAWGGDALVDTERLYEA